MKFVIVELYSTAENTWIFRKKTPDLVINHSNVQKLPNTTDNYHGKHDNESRGHETKLAETIANHITAHMANNIINTGTGIALPILMHLARYFVFL
jgi:stalled ribosome rescue protein Dom34